MLSYLGRVFSGSGAGDGGVLEVACWELMEEHGHEILEENKQALGTLISENPALTQELMLRMKSFQPSLDGGGSKKRRRTA